MKRRSDQKKPENMERFAPSGFFVLRTPLLAFDELLAWGEGLEASSADADADQLAGALERDRSRLRGRLAAIFSRPAMREALFVAAPELEELLDLWLRDPQQKRVERVELALARYFQRMAGRATPFGLFAGCSVGSISDATRLTIEGQAECRRHTRLDMDYLFALVEELRGQESLKNSLRYFTNSSLYSAVGRVRYVESRLKDNYRTYHLVAADESIPLADTLARARAGATARELAEALAADGFPLADAAGFIDELIEGQLLLIGKRNWMWVLRFDVSERIAPDLPREDFNHPAFFERADYRWRYIRSFHQKVKRHSIRFRFQCLDYAELFFIKRSIESPGL